jgi:hypothetical protein
MVALSILVIGFLGILTLLAQSIHISKNLSDQVTATYLAEEGIELSKNILDYDMYRRVAGTDGTGWGLGGVDPTLVPGHSYEIDYTSCNNLLSSAPTCHLFSYSADTVLGFDPNPGPQQDLYFYGAPDPTPFTREIRVTSTGVNEITIDSIVRWTVGGGTQEIDLEDHFYNWHP